MASILANQTQKQDEETVIPMSPSSQILTSSILSLTILFVVELETILDEFEIVDFINNLFLPTNARFSSIVDVDEKGAACWKKINVKVEDHIIVPTFPEGLSIMDYDGNLREYVSKIAGEQLSTNQPLWEIHIVKYPNLNGEGSVVFKISHAIGDGYSLISAVYAAFRRVDDPTLPLALPNISLRGNGLQKRSCWNFFPKCMNTISDGTWTLLKGCSLLEDSKTAVRSGKPGVQFDPIAISYISIPMESLKRVKSKVGGTLNDLITGVIYYTIHLYMLKKGDISRGKSMNFVVMFNTRMLKGYKNMEEMLKANLWGNYVALLTVPVSCMNGENNVDPLYFVTKAKKIMDRMKNSFYAYLTNTFIKMFMIIGGQKSLSKYIHSNLKNTTALVTNLIGPNEKMAMAGHPVGSCYFIVAGLPQSLAFTTASWMGQLRITATMEKNFIDSQLFNSCMKEAFENIFQAACDGEITS
ncbi:O-acyltransferase wsd1 [Thalictrum thalictroides]|uniref:O-acyltransferase wsd1 n=1 Tax=Thalictrum thalictroides TaxID=46969 RepID=A0A7J6WXA9_THATH|nr:O-acyltransferase wsd1 [Thalictrum thalictroides]